MDSKLEENLLPIGRLIRSVTLESNRSWCTSLFWPQICQAALCDHSKVKCTVQRSAGSITMWFPVPVWLFGPRTAALCVADWSPENVKLSTTVSIKLPVRAIRLVYTCQQGTLVDKTNPQSLNCLSSGISCGGQLFADVFVLIISTLGMVSVCEWYYSIDEYTEILWFTRRKGIMLSAGVFMMYFQLHHISHTPKTWLFVH